MSTVLPPAVFRRRRARRSGRRRGDALDVLEAEQSDGRVGSVGRGLQELVPRDDMRVRGAAHAQDARRRGEGEEGAL